MKITKQVALLVVLAVSILPGCGKKNGDANANNPIGINTGFTTLPNGNVVASSFAVSGSVSFTPGNGYMMGTLSQSNIGSLPGGNTYVHYSTAQDQVNLVINGSSAYAIVYLAQGTISWFQTYCGGMPSALNFQYTVLNSPQAGQFTSGIRLIAGNGCGMNI